MLLLAVSANAQSITDLARRERERKANTKPAAVLTTESAKVPEKSQPEVKSSDAKPEETKPAAPAETAKPGTAPSPAQPAKAADQAPKPEDEALKKYNEDLSKARARVIELQDRQTALQLQFQDLKNTFLAPVTDPDARSKAQAQMTDTEVQISENQRELADAQRQVQMLEAQGPPKPGGLH